MFTENSSLDEIINHKAFEGFGSLLFPVDFNIDGTMTIGEASSPKFFKLYTDIHVETSLSVVNYLKEMALCGKQIFYPIYSKNEVSKKPELAKVGLFFFRGKEGAPFAITNAGSGFYYVAAMHDSFPQALEISKLGYNAFALIYRRNMPYEDLARAIIYIHDHADLLKVNKRDYSLWGGSAGGRMAIRLGNRKVLRELTDRIAITENRYMGHIPKASAVISQYTAYNLYDIDDAPTYGCIGKEDSISHWNIMKKRLDGIEALGIPVDFHLYEGIGHGFGIGKGTNAEGWVKDGVKFWERQMKYDLRTHNN